MEKTYFETQFAIPVLALPNMNKGVSVPIGQKDPSACVMPPNLQSLGVGENLLPSYIVRRRNSENIELPTVIQGKYGSPGQELKSPGLTKQKTLKNLLGKSEYLWT